MEVLRLNQKIIDPLIWDFEPKALTLDYVLKNLTWYCENREFIDVKILDLIDTWASEEDFIKLMKFLLPYLSKLEIVLFPSINLFKIQSLLFELTNNRLIKYLDVTNCINTKTQLFELLKENDLLTKKLIFLRKSFYNKAIFSDKFPLERKEILKVHSDYYSDELLQIKDDEPLRFLTGDSDEDRL